VDFRTLILVAPVLLFSMVAHEYAHGYAAFRQGDTTAYALGRLTWNPVKHIDPYMTVLLPLMLWFSSGGRFLFGGAKPVPVDPRNYKHYKRGDIIVSLAGIVTNLLLAGLCALLVVPLGLLGRGAGALTPSLAILQEMMLAGIVFNLMLAFFNLLPIPPLDGSKVLYTWLPASAQPTLEVLERFSFIILIIVIKVGVLNYIFDPVWSVVERILRW
jgi:Zn-dependent protease